jgi:hypothetical protein
MLLAVMLCLAHKIQDRLDRPSLGTTTTIAATVSSYDCPSGYTLAGSTCTLTTTTTGAATPNYSCPSGCGG